MMVLPLRLQAPFHLVVVCLLSVGMLVACGRTGTVSGPPPETGSLPSVVEEGPGPTQPIPRTVPTQNIRHIHNRLLQEARHHFQAREFPKAIRELKRLLGLNPQADLERDGRWWLGQSYDQVEDWKSAQREYGVLASAPAGQSYQSHSRQRLIEIQGFLAQDVLPPKDSQAIRFALNQLPAAEGFEQGIAKMKQDGITTLLIDLGCQRTALTPSSSSDLMPLPDFSSLQELVHDYAKRSHRVGLLLYIGVNLRCLGHWAPSQHEAWRDQMYHHDTNRGTPTEWFDLFHPAYQEFLTRSLAHLCKGGVDGLVFLNDHPLGPYDGLTRIGRKRFEKQFGVAFDPSQLFQQGFDPLGITKKSSGILRTKISNKENSLYWRWTGWKARTRLTLLEVMVERLRMQYPAAQFGLELHPHGLTDPVGALVRYTEDAMDAAGRSFSFFFVRPEIDRRSTFTEKAVIAKLRRISTKAVLDRLLPVVDDPRRVWVSLPAKIGERLRLQGTSAVSPLKDFPSGIGVVHDLRSFS